MTPLTELPATFYMEPPRGNRRARVACSVPGCAAPVIDTRWLCDDHDRMVPAALRKENRQIRRDAEISANNDEFMMLMAALQQNQLACINAVIAKLDP